MSVQTPDELIPCREQVPVQTEHRYNQFCDSIVFL